MAPQSWMNKPADPASGLILLGLAIGISMTVIGLSLAYWTIPTWTESQGFACGIALFAPGLLLAAASGLVLRWRVAKIR